MCLQKSGASIPPLSLVFLLTTSADSGRLRWLGEPPPSPSLPLSGRLLIVVLSFVIIGDVSCAGGESPSSLHQMKGTSSLPLITSLSCPPLFLILCPRSCSSSPPVLVKKEKKKKKRRARQNSVQNSATAGSFIIILIRIAAAPLYLHVQMHWCMTSFFLQGWIFFI